MAESTALQAKYKITKSDVVQTNTLSKGQKITQLEGTGTLKMNKISSYMIKLLLADIKKGIMPDITIITALKDPASLGTERVKITGVSFDELTLADWEANKLGEESYPFTFADAAITIQEIDAERLMELQTLPLDKAGNYNFQQGYAANLMTVAEGVINPDLKSKELQEHFGAINASDLAKILFKTEVPEIATEIANLSSPDVVDDEELKN